jgi:fumarylpyruvate hydrolase
VNGQSRQDATVADMIWNTAEIISEASKLWTLKPGDLIYTGTPAGVAAVGRGQTLTGRIAGLGDLVVRLR